MTLSRVLFLTLFAVLPFEGAQALRMDLGAISVSIVDVMIAALVFAAMLRVAISGMRVDGFTAKICLLLLGTAVLSTISLAYLPGTNIGYDVKITLNLVLFSGLIFSVSAIAADRDVLRRALTMLTLATLVLALGTIAKGAGYDVPGDVRMSARHYLGPFLIGVTAFVEAGMLFSMPILAAFPVALVGRGLSPWYVRLPLAVLLVVASIISYSRNLWLSQLLQVLVALYLARGTIGMRWKRAFALSMLALTVLAISLKWVTIYETLIALRPKTVADRLEGYLYGITMMGSDLVYFLFGFGKGQFVNTAAEATVPHNFLLDFLVSKGVVPFCLLLFTFLVAGRRFVAEFRLASSRYASPEAMLGRYFLVAFSGMFVAGMFAPLVNSTVLWSTVALTVAYCHGEQRSRRLARGARQAGRRV